MQAEKRPFKAVIHRDLIHINLRQARLGHDARLDLDTAYLEAQTFGDTDLSDELLRLFVEQCRALVPIILRDGEQRPGAGTPSHADAAHTLRGGALAIGAGRLARLAGEVERQARAGSVDSALQGGLERAVADLHIVIAARLDAGAGSRAETGAGST